VPLLGGIAWVVAIVSAVGAWWQTRQGIESTACYWNALAFGVIALYAHRKRVGACKMGCCSCGGQCSGGKC